MKIGFPVVLDDKCYAIWIKTISGDNPKIKVNDTNIPTDSLNENPALDKFLEKIIDDKRSIQFICDKEIEKTLIGLKIGKKILKLEGNSFGFAMRLVCLYELDNLNKDDLNILLSGAISDRPYNPMPLDNEETIRKAEFSINNRYILVLHPDDYKALEKTGIEGFHYGLDAPESRLPNNLHELQEKFKNTRKGRGRVFALPINTDFDKSKWQHDDSDWIDGLGSLLGLTKVSSHNKRDDNDDSTALKNAVSINEQDFIGKIGEIYYKALPTAIEYRDNFIANNCGKCNDEVIDGGILQEAIKKYMDIFKERDDDDFINRHLLINGPTGCGKTFLTEALMLNSTIEIPDGRAMYIAPTKSLVYEHFRVLKDKLENNDSMKENEIVYSTGEHSCHDNRIRNGNFKIALLVYEKANLFLDTSGKLLEKLSLVIIDEIHMINHDGRGGIIDMFLAKIAYVNRKRFIDNKKSDKFIPPIRIAIISTEPLTAKKSFFILNNQEPIEISAKNRLNAIPHSLVVYGNDSGSNKNIECEIIKFENQEDRFQTKEGIKRIRKSLEDGVLKKPKVLEALRRNHNFENTFDFSNFILCKSRIFNSILVAIPSLDQIKKIATHICNTLPNKLPNEKEIANLSKFKEDIGNSELSNSDKKLLKKMAEKGIFLHYAGIPYKLRDWVETSFRKTEEDVRKILFATETLFYGVNISTDCVILSSLQWPRQDPESFNVENKPLTTAEYHNILGRAGRPNHPLNDKIHAYVCIHANDFNNDDIENIIDYYKDSKKTAISKLFLAADECHYDDKTITHLDDISYPAFRTVIDAIRYLTSADKSVTQEDIEALLKRTLFHHDNQEDNFINGITKIIIEQGGKYKFNRSSSFDTPLVIGGKEGRGYKITLQAESLIVTGTHWKSIAPMYSWLSKIKKFADDAEFPIEILVPALIAAPDLWRILRQFCAEQGEKKEPNDSLVEENEKYALRELEYELSILFIQNSRKTNSFLTLINEYVDEQENILDVLQYKFRKAIFIKLTAAFLKWLRGEEMEAISKLSILYNSKNMSKETTDTLQTKYVEKANWLSIMMLKFFVDQNVLSSSQIRNLPTLSLRLRYGVVSEAIPYIGGFGSSTHQLERSQIRELMDNKITPERLIKNPDDNYESYQLSVDISKAKKNVILFHQQQIKELAEVFNEEGYTQWEPFSKTFSSYLGDNKIKLNAENFTELLHSLLTMREKISATIQTNNKSIRITSSDKAILLHVLSNEDKLEICELPSIIIRYPWIVPSASEKIVDVIEIGICCGMVLATLIGRNFLNVSNIVSLTENFNIKDLVAACTDDSNLPTDILEKLLQFIEL